MGTIEKRGKGSWRIGVQVKTLDGWQWVRETIHVDPLLSEAKQRKEAEKAMLLLKVEIEDGKKVPSKGAETVRSWSETWMEKEIKPNASPVTYSDYRYLLDSRILPLLGDVPLASLTPIMLTEWLAQVRDSPRKTVRKKDDDLAHKRPPSQTLITAQKQARPLSNSTVAHYHSCMDAMLSAAVRLEILPNNPMDKVRKPPIKKKRVKFLTEEQALDLLRSLKDEPNMCYRAALLLALLCGLRLGEVGELKLSDIDWKKGTIDISRALKYTAQHGGFVDDPKTEAGQRIISLPAGMMVVLEETRKYQEECRQLVPHLWRGQGWIVHGWDGRQLHHDTPSKWFRRFADAHGYQGVTFHNLRHTHATLLLANNIDVVTVAYRMGHSDPSVTLRVYAHALGSRDQAAAHAFDQLFGDIDLPPAPDLHIE